ncbi:MAG: HAD family phosphatase [Pirellulales bacterium]
MPPRFLYFDLGNVLLTFCHERMCRQMAEVAGVTPEEIAQTILPTAGRGDLQWRLESGAITADEYYDVLCEALGKCPPREKLSRAACDIFDVIPETRLLVERLAAAGNRMAILSNTNLVHWQFVTDGRYPHLNECFLPPLLSCEVGVMKPDRRIYEVATERTGVTPSEVFFVDDRPDNVAGAIAAGIDAVQFTTPEQLVTDLRKRGVPGA